MGEHRFFNTIAELYSAERDGSLAELATLRTKELKAKGRVSLHPKSDQISFSIVGAPEPALRKDLEKWYHSTRSKAGQRQEDRQAYLRKGLVDGRHPDTDPEFWNNWSEPDFPTLPGARFSDYFSFTHHPAVFVVIPILLLIGLWVISLIRRKSQAKLQPAR